MCHALTANSDPVDWWPGLVGEGFTIDPADYFIVCANMLGSCYGTTGPTSNNPATGKPYGLDFPLVTTRDMARAHRLLADHLGIDRVRLIIGGSMGGQQALEWCCLQPERFDLLCALATNARHSPWGIACNETQRMALRADPTFGTDAAEAGRAGLEAARAAAILTYRHYETYRITQSDPLPILNDFRAASYQRYQGHKLWRRFNPVSYYRLGQAMDSHNLARDRTGVAEALASIRAKALVIGIDTDGLFPLEEQALLSRYLPHARLEVMNSDYGHDGFLTETRRIGQFLTDFLADELRVDEGTKQAFTDSLTGRKFALPGTEEV